MPPGCPENNQKQEKLSRYFCIKSGWTTQCKKSKPPGLFKSTQFRAVIFRPPARSTMSGKYFRRKVRRVSSFEFQDVGRWIVLPAGSYQLVWLAGCPVANTSVQTAQLWAGWVWGGGRDLWGGVKK